MFPESRAGAILTIVAGVLALLIGVFVVLAGIASYKVSKVERRWAASWGTEEQILQRYPSTDAGTDALELERLTASLGIDTATRSDEKRIRPDKEMARANAAFRTALGPWSNAQLERGYRGIDPPPAQVLAYLETHDAHLESIRRHLTRGVVPRWEMHLEDGVEAPIRNLLGHINLQKLLVGDALVRMHQGDRVTAQRDLEAGWTLLRSLRGDPFLISQLIAVADARLITGALRQLENPPAIWRERLVEQDFRTKLTDALKYEGWCWTKLEDTSPSKGLSGVARRLVIGVAKPYVKLCMADTSETFLERLENLDEVTAICDYDLSSRQADLNIPIPSWNLFGGMGVPNLGQVLERLARLEVDLELTAHLVDVERRRLANAGSWPDSLPGGEVSTACPQDRWLYDVSEDGRMTLALAREPSWSGLKGHRLPTAFAIE